MNNEQNIPQDSSFRQLMTIFKSFVKRILDIREDTNQEATVEEVKAGILMRGQAAWVLIFSILIASAGLNTSSTAVVIGAMLISPLMGPIVGIGMSLAINDVDLLRKAIKNFGVMVALALFTSFLFFSIPIFQNETPELIARTYPDVRDVIIALAGGLALIVALSRRTKQFNTIAGVAIATALMPPLCTAGYGLATFKFNFFGGAMFLFTINTIFISLGTFLVVRFLNFPMVVYVDSSMRKRISQVVYTVSLVIIIPSVYLFYKLYRETDFKQRVETMLTDYKNEQDLILLNEQIDGTKLQVSFATLGKGIPKTKVEEWKTTLKDLGYDGVQFDIAQNVENAEAMFKIDQLERTYMNTQQLLNKKEEIIVKQERELIEMQKQLSLSEKGKVPFLQLAQEIKANYDQVVEVSYARTFVTDFDKVDTIPVVYLKFAPDYYKKEADKKRIQNWLQLKLGKPNLEVESIP
jgi:uncharacterized hydrophobic protein (TIGR00271 family)